MSELNNDLPKQYGIIDQTEPRRVLVGTPTLTGSVTSWYLDSLVSSVKICAANGIDLCPITLVGESILPMARNELLSIAHELEAEALIFIDADQAWEPLALLDTVNSGYDVVGLPVVSKTDEPGQFNVRIHDLANLESDENGYTKVHAVGTGFLKLSKEAIIKLWENSESVNFRGKAIKTICQYSTIDGDFVGEDVGLSLKLKELGFDVWINPNSTCAHIGNKIWTGDFSSFISFMRGLQGS